MAKTVFALVTCMCWSMPSLLRRTNSCRRCWLGRKRGHSVCSEAAGHVQNGTGFCTSRRAELSESSSLDISGKANMEPTSKATLESCSPACTWQSQAPAAALRGQGSSKAQPGMLAQGTPSWGCLPAKQGAEPSWERQAPAPSVGVHGRQHASGAGSGWQGENSLRANSLMTMSLNRKLVWKCRLSASPAAWRGGANSFEHRCRRSAACSAPSPALSLAAAACKVQPPRSPAGSQGHRCCLATFVPHCRVWRLSLSAVIVPRSLLCKQLMKFGHSPDDPAFFIYGRPGRFVGEGFY